MKLERLHITVFLGIAVAVWLAALKLAGTPVTMDHAAPFTWVVGTLVLVWLLCDKFLWRQACLKGWFFKRPDLRGTWRVVIHSSYVKPETKEQAPPFVCYMGVEQTLLELNMHLMTPESESTFIASYVRESQNGNGYQVIGVYTNEPVIHLRDQRVSEIHQGALIIETHGNGVRPDSLTGKYWTDRKTTGTMDFTDRISQIHTRFSSANTAFLSPKSTRKGRNLWRVIKNIWK